MTDPITIKMENVVFMIGELKPILETINRLERELLELISAEDARSVEALLDGQVLTIDNEYRFVKGEHPSAEFIMEMDQRRRDNVAATWDTITVRIGMRYAGLEYGIKMRTLLEESHDVFKS